jgi:arsenate reductase
VTAHWGVPDPATVAGTPEEIKRAFFEAYVALEQRIELFLSLPIASMDALALKQKLTEIGEA